MKYLLSFFIISLIFCSIRFQDEQMLRRHHTHTSNSDTPLTVFLMPHSHDDVGWLKTVDDYFYGSDQSTQWAGVRYTIESVVTELSRNPSYKFSIVEMAFLYRWWNTANSTQKELLKTHIAKGQLEIINGGWCMHDEATTYYEDIIDQMTTGLTWLKNTLNVVPTIGWHIDPFGHQSSNAAIFSQLGFNAWFFSRVDYQDKQNRLDKKSFEMIWNPPQYSNNDNSIFTHLNYFNYQAPPGFCFDNTCNDEPIKSDPTLVDYNLLDKAQNLTQYFKSMSTHFRSANLFHTIGEDFHYSNARMWFMNFDKLFNHINNNQSYGVTFKYATPGEYISAINNQGPVYPTNTADFYPYADRIHGYWTGYFTSRVSLKSLVRQLGKYFQAVKNHISLLSLSNQSPYISNNRAKVQSAIWEMEMAQGILQHHDAVAGTAKQKVTNDYVMIASRAYTALNNVYDEIRKEVFNREVGEQGNVVKTLWNATWSEWGISTQLTQGGNVLLHLYNPGSADSKLVKVKLDNTLRYINILKSNGDIIKGDLICSNTLDSKDCELVFIADFSQTAYTYIKLVKLSSGGSVKYANLETIPSSTPSKTFTITDKTKVTFTRADGKIAISSDQSYQITPSYNYYESYQDEDIQKSGAYIFRPSVATINSSKKYTNFKNYHFAEGDSVTVLVYEGDKTYTKVYFSKVDGEIETKGFEIETFVNSIDVSDNQGKQIVMNLAHTQNNNKTFYTDSNGLEDQPRVVNYRPTWNLTVHQPISGNYYPINSHISVIDINTKNRLSVLVDRAEGGTACKDGSIELMIHRRTLMDDRRGVGEPLNETEGGKGLTQKIRHWVVYGEGHRERQKENDQPVVVTWSASSSSTFAKSNISSAAFPVDKNAKLFLRPYTNQTYLLRIQNFHTTATKSIKIPDGWKTVETTMAGNQLLSEWKSKQFKWKEEKMVKLNERRLHEELVVEEERDGEGEISVKPFEIKTFLLSKQ